MLVDFLSSSYVLQSLCHLSIADIVCHRCILFLHFSCYAEVQCNSTSLVTACTNLAAQRSCLIKACVDAPPSNSKWCNSSSKCAKHCTVCLVIKLCRGMVWQSKYSTGPQVCTGAALYQHNALQQSMPSLPQLPYSLLRILMQHHDKINIYGSSMYQDTCTISASNIHTCNNINANTYACQ